VKKLATKRKCGLCGDSGHTARNCPLKEEDRRWAEHQKTLETPTKIHIGGWEQPYLCDAEKEWWPERCMSDEFAQTLPVCEACETAYEKKFGRKYSEVKAHRQESSANSNNPNPSSD